MKKLFLLAFLIFLSANLYSQVPNPPNLLSPPNNSTGINPVGVLLDWSDVSGAISYNVQISLNSSFSAIVFDDNPTISQDSIQPGVLSSLTTYYWHVNVTTSGGVSDWSTTFHFTTSLGSPQAPVLISPPNNAVSVPIQPSFNWGGVPGATGYIIQISRHSNFDTLVVCDTTPFATIILQYSTLYYWRMRAFNVVGAGNWSSVFNFTTVTQIPDPPVLISPADSTIIPVTGQIFLWNIVLTATSYRIQISISPDFSTTVVNQATGSQTQYTHNSPPLANNTIYYWRVNATNSGGTSTWSTVWRVITVPATPPAPIVYPVNRGRPVYSDSATIFEWHKVSTATSYRIQISTGSNYIINEIVYDTIYIAPPNTFTNYTMYYWRVAAINSGGQGSFSTSWNFSVIPHSLNPPTLISPINNAINVPLNPTLDWSDVTGAMSYRVQISTTSNFSLIILNVTGLSNSAYSVMSNILANCTQYYWRVKVYIPADSSSWSNVWTFTTICNSGINLISSEIPTENKLYNNYPNPFNPSTNIKYQITKNGLTTLKVFDILGKEIATLVNEIQKPGTYEIQFSINQYTNNQIPSGIYYYTIQTEDFNDTKKMVILK
jgi:hypothetical protein